MREIKFRGKTKEGKWIYGSGIIKVIENCTETKKIEMISTVDYDELDYYVPMYDNEEVIPETVGQYTGLKDKNGKEIYEGDIITIPEWLINDNQKVCICIYDQENTVSDIIGFGLYTQDGYSGKFKILVNSDEWDEFEVIGNIYDNLKLLGGNNGD